MDPETPSRRKKSGGEPKTVDLEAVPTTASNEAVAEGAAAPEDVVEDGRTDAEQSARSEMTEPEAAAERESTAEAGEHEPAPATAHPAAAADAGSTSGRASSSGAFAAAILGGLIALAGAGALQYGGYLPAPGPATASVDVETLTAEIEALKAQVAASPAATEALDLAPIESRLTSLEQTAAATGAAQDGAGLAEIETRIDAIGEEIAALRTELAKVSSASSETVAELTERLAAAEEKIEEPRSDVAMARAVAASALKTAIDRGGPFLAELEAYASVSPDDQAVAGLRESAATGVRSRSDLARDFPDAAGAILDAIHQPSGDAGIVDRLLSSAASVVRVRPVGSIEGDTPEAIVARIETKLQNGDFKGAQIEWQALPEPGRNAATDYKAALDRRVSVEDAVGAVVSGAMSPKQG